MQQSLGTNKNSQLVQFIWRKYILSSKSLPWTSSCKKSALHRMCNTTDSKTKSHPPTCRHQGILTSTTNFNTYTPSLRKPEPCTLYWPENTHKTNLPTPEATETGPLTKWWTLPDLEKDSSGSKTSLLPESTPNIPEQRFMPSYTEKIQSAWYTYCDKEWYKFFCSDYCTKLSTYPDHEISSYLETN